MRIVALGATGQAGAEIVRLLAPRLAVTDELVLAGRSAAKLAAIAASVSGPVSLSTVVVDAADTAAVRTVFAGAQLVIVTVSRPDLIGRLAELAIEAGADWIDTMLSTPTKLAALIALSDRIREAGLCFVTDAGFHPGLPAALVRWAGAQLDDLVEADVHAGLRVDWKADELADSTVDEMLDEFSDFTMETWIDGRRRPLRWSECPKIDFGAPIGVQQVMPMPLAEMDDLPQRYPSLQRCGFYISGFGPAMDYLALPAIMVMAKFRGLRAATIRFTRWSVGRLASVPPPHRLVVQLEAVGRRGGLPAPASVTVGGSDSYLLTGAPVVACLDQVRDGTARRPGLHYQAQLVEPNRFLDDMALLGLEVTRIS
jgi:Saccharopine dehydrogenase and related proteins